uniref:Uncharacterized protein n=1 Tax=Laticauda laticaudata TaxID=8630 RepID=A0A8C5S5H9_LATLA
MPTFQLVCKTMSGQGAFVSCPSGYLPTSCVCGMGCAFWYIHQNSICNCQCPNINWISAQCCKVSFN